MPPFSKIMLLAGAFAFGALPALGQSLSEGFDAAQSGDYATALENFEQLAGQGNAAAQFNLGIMYDNGEGVPQNDSKAFEWYRKAAGQGFAAAQRNLGNMYRNGNGVPQNDSKAVEWFREAAEQGYADAQVNLGYMYDNGKGVRQNDFKAVEWYRKAAEQGLADAQYGLGMVYSIGIGVSRNPVMAYVASNLAAAQGDERSRKLRDREADGLSRDQLAEGQRMSSEWRVGTPLPYLKDFNTWP